MGLERRIDVNLHAIAAGCGGVQDEIISRPAPGSVTANHLKAHGYVASVFPNDQIPSAANPTVTSAISATS